MNRLDLDDPKIWDTWRELYPTLTTAEQKQFMTECEERFPGQKHHTVDNFHFLFNYRTGRVLEIGGWKGELAQTCLAKYPIRSWENVELCKEAIEKTVEMEKGWNYQTTCPDDFDWFKNPRTRNYDICVSAHCIEHFSNEHLRQLIEYISGIKLVMFEAPIGNEDSNWDGYIGTHILKMGWFRIVALMKVHGYSYTRVNEHCFLFEKP